VQSTDRPIFLVKNTGESIESSSGGDRLALSHFDLKVVVDLLFRPKRTAADMARYREIGVTFPQSPNFGIAAGKPDFEVAVVEDFHGHSPFHASHFVWSHEIDTPQPVEYVAQKIGAQFILQLAFSSKF
jgi:hypothetical protein